MAFEVWWIQVGLTLAQLRACAALDAVVDEVSSPAVSIGGLADFLRDWHGVDVRLLRLPPDSTLRLSLRSCPVGLLADALARALDIQWCYTKDKLIFCPKSTGDSTASGAYLRDTEAIVGRLRRAFPGCEGSAERAPPESPESHLNPDGPVSLAVDPAGICVAGRRRIAEMRFDEAARCLEALSRVSHPFHPEAVARMKKRCALLKALCGEAPVSALLAADRVSSVAILRPGAPALKLPAQIVERKGRLVVLRTERGIVVGLPERRFREEDSVPAAQWLKERTLEMERREAALSAAPLDRQARELLALARMAKAHGFPGRGADYLERAIGMEALEHVLATDYVARPELMRLWREATGRAPSGGAQAASSQEAR